MKKMIWFLCREFHTDYEKKKEDWKQYVEEIKSFLAKEEPENDISLQKIKKSSKQKDTQQEKLFQKEEQLSLF